MKYAEAVEEFLAVMVKGGVIVSKEGGRARSKTIENPYSPTTTKYYSKLLRDFGEFLGPDAELGLVTMEACSRYFNASSYKHTSRRTMQVVLSRFFKIQEDVGRIPANPWVEFSKSIDAGGRAEAEATGYVREQDTQRLINSRNLHLAVGAGIQVAMGLRMSELLGNEWSVGRVSGALHGITLKEARGILQFRNAPPRERRFALRGKGKKTRETVFIGMFIDRPPGMEKLFFDKLEGLIARREAENLAAGAVKGAVVDDRLLNIDGSEYNSLLKDTEVPVYSKETRQVLTKSLTSHTLRHTFGVYFINNGGAMSALKVLMGHTTERTTNRYGKATPEGVLSDVERMLKTA